MKKYLLALSIIPVLFSAFSSSVSAQSATVTVDLPSGLQQWPAGSIKVIRWAASGIFDYRQTTIQVVDVAPNGPERTLVVSSVGEDWQGEKIIRIPTTIPLGSYKIRVMITYNGGNSTAVGDSSQFQVTFELPPSVTITSSFPNIRLDDTIHLRWDSTGNVGLSGLTVEIAQQSNGLTTYRNQEVMNDGVLDIPVTPMNGFIPGQTYTLFLYSAGRGVFDQGSAFSVDDAPTINITSPVCAPTCPIWQANVPNNITWTSTGITSDVVINRYLSTDTGRLDSLATVTLDSASFRVNGSHTYTIPANIFTVTNPPSSYFYTITGNSIFDQSGNFTVTTGGGATCGNSRCEAEAGETATSCPADCTGTPDIGTTPTPGWHPPRGEDPDRGRKHDVLIRGDTPVCDDPATPGCWPPINASSFFQRKIGDLSLRGFGALWANFKDNVLIGGNSIADLTPSLKLDVEGKVGAREYCDANGDNCVPGGTSPGGSGVSKIIAGDNIILGPAGVNGLGEVRISSTGGSPANLSDCSDGQVLKWNNGLWGCGVDEGGVAGAGDITMITSDGDDGGLLIKRPPILSTDTVGGEILSGDVAISLRRDCGGGKILKWRPTGSLSEGWECASDEGGVAGTGDITAVNTPSGGGLEGGATSGSVSLTLPVCNENLILKRTMVNNALAWRCVPDDTGGAGGWDYVVKQPQKIDFVPSNSSIVSSSIGLSSNRQLDITGKVRIYGASTGLPSASANQVLISNSSGEAEWGSVPGLATPQVSSECYDPTGGTNANSELNYLICSLNNLNGITGNPGFCALSTVDLKGDGYCKVQKVNTNGVVHWEIKALGRGVVGVDWAKCRAVCF
ncbi:MAG: hypothetical protein AAB415_02240 [Patescibacteria group bacterium]